MKKIQEIKKSGGKYLYYFLVTSIIPVVIILVMNLVLQNMIKKQVLESGNKVLAQFFTYLDSYMENMVLDVKELVEDDALIEFARKNAYDFKKYAYYPPILRENLRKYKNKGYVDILVWYAYDDRIISLNNPSRLIEDFYRYSYNEASSEYCYNGIDMENFYNVVKGKSKIPVFSRLEREDGKQYLCVTLGQYVSQNSSYHFAVTIIMEEKLLQEMTDEAILGNGERICLYNENGELLLSSREDAMRVLQEDYRLQGIYEIEEADGKDMLIVFESEAFRGFYAMQISKEAFWEALGVIRFISWFGILCSLFCGGLVAWKYGSKTHSSFEDILETLKMHQNESTQKLQLEEEEKRRNEFLIKVLEKDEIEKCTIEVFKENGIDLFSENVFVGVLAMRKGWDIGKGQISYIIASVFKELLKNVGGCYVLHLSTLRHLIIVNPEEGETEETLMNLFFKGASFLNEQLDVGAVVGCSKMTKDLFSICEAYRSAQNALEYRFILEDKMVISFRDIVDREFVYLFTEESIMYQMFKSFLKSEEESSSTAENFVERLMKVYGINRESSMETVECFQYELLQVLNRFLDINRFSRFEREEYLVKLSEAKGFTEYCEVLCEIVEVLVDDYKRMSMKGELGKQIWNYLEEHYADSRINVTAIGEAFGMQAAYLSKIFRAEYGMGLSDYISKVRVNKSKQLLKEKKLTIGEIAECVGFMSSNIYINNFKRWEGITPGKYRELKDREHVLK